LSLDDLAQISTSSPTLRPVRREGLWAYRVRSRRLPQSEVQWNKHPGVIYGEIEPLLKLEPAERLEPLVKTGVDRPS
jgi:hypothetical protein